MVRTGRTGERARRRRTANERFKQRCGRAFPLALALSAGLHAASFGLPHFKTEVWANPSPRSLQLIETTELLVLSSEVPRPPDIVRPSVPEVPTVLGLVEPVLDLPESVLARFPTFELPPPPAALAESEELKRYHSFMPTMVAPELKNRRQVQREFERRIPRSVLEAGADGRVRLLLWIDEEGAVRKHEIRQSSGSRAFDRAVENLVALLEFRPTLWHGRPVATVVDLPFSFYSR